MRLALLLPFLLALSACGEDAAPAAPPADSLPAPAAVDGRQTVYDVVETTPDLSRLAALVNAAGLEPTLSDTAQVLTLFAPSDAAFGALPPETLDALRADPDALRDLLLGHALANRTLSGDVFGEITIESLGGTDLTLDADDAGVTVQRGPTTATVTDADLDAENGVVHVIDTVLAPSPDA